MIIKTTMLIKEFFVQCFVPVYTILLNKLYFLFDLTKNYVQHLQKTFPEVDITITLFPVVSSFGLIEHVHLFPKDNNGVNRNSS